MLKPPAKAPKLTELYSTVAVQKQLCWASTPDQGGGEQQNSNGHLCADFDREVIHRFIHRQQHLRIAPRWGRFRAPRPLNKYTHLVDTSRIHKRTSDTPKSSCSIGEAALTPSQQLAPAPFQKPGRSADSETPVPSVTLVRYPSAPDGRNLRLDISTAHTHGVRPSRSIQIFTWADMGRLVL